MLLQRLQTTFIDLDSFFNKIPIKIKKLTLSSDLIDILKDNILCDQFLVEYETFSNPTHPPADSTTPTPPPPPLSLSTAGNSTTTTPTTTTTTTTTAGDDTAGRYLLVKFHRLSGQYTSLMQELQGIVRDKRQFICHEHSLEKGKELTSPYFNMLTYILTYIRILAVLYCTLHCCCLLVLCIYYEHHMIIIDPHMIIIEVVYRCKTGSNSCICCCS